MSDQNNRKVISLPPEVEERVKAWVESPEGSKAINDALARARETIRQLQGARKIDWRDLHEPMMDWNKKRFEEGW